MATPRASSTSAEPALDDGARPPCLHTGTPAPATTTAAMVETLIVPLRSPPVPQVSTRRSASESGTRTRSAASIMAPTSPVISSTVSPLHRIPKMNAAIWAGVALPSRMSAMAARASCWARWPPDTRRARTAGHPPARRASGPGPSTSRPSRKPLPEPGGSCGPGPPGPLRPIDRRRRMIRRRSRSVAPPHTPSFSREVRAHSRHAPFTGHRAHMALASSASSSDIG